MDSSTQAKGALAAAVAGAAADLSSISAADLSRGMSSISPAEQMAIVEAAQRAARESDGGMLIARNHSSDEAMVGSWVSSMEAVWGGLAAVEARKHQTNIPGHSTSPWPGSGSGKTLQETSSVAEEGSAGDSQQIAACRNEAGPALDGAAGADSGAATDGRTADVGAQGGDVQHEQVGGAVDPQQLQPAVATLAS